VDEISFRSGILFAYGASMEAVGELLAYNADRLSDNPGAPPPQLPLSSELHIEAWQKYALEAQQSGLWPTLKRHLVQLNFPIRQGMSQHEDYQAAARRGAPVKTLAAATGLELAQPQQLQLHLHPTPAGVVPILVAAERRDFVSLVQAFTRRNEPEPLPDSMGACIVSGYNNWSRIAELRRRWEAETATDAGPANWALEFRRAILPFKAFYQDTFILLSAGPYSGVAAPSMGMTDEAWRQHSLTIRREHECAHYLTYRLFGSMRNHLLDELIADYYGIVGAIGHYRADWFLRFMGLEAFPEYRPGGRLENYRGEPPLSDNAFRLLQRLVKDSAENLAHFDQTVTVESGAVEKRAYLVMALASLTLEETASQAYDQLLKQRLTMR
jgi:hypothetical protein